MKDKKSLLAMAGTVLMLAACSPSDENRGAYSEKGGGSLEGAGGAGPGYDGTASGRGEHGTVPDSGAARKGEAAHTQTNTALPNPAAAAGEQPKSPSVTQP